MNVCDFPDDILVQCYYETNNRQIIGLIKNDNIILEMINNYLSLSDTAMVISNIYHRRNVDKIIEQLLNKKEYKSIHDELLHFIKDDN